MDNAANTKLNDALIKEIPFLNFHIPYSGGVENKMGGNQNLLGVWGRGNRFWELFFLRDIQIINILEALLSCAKILTEWYKRSAFLYEALRPGFDSRSLRVRIPVVSFHDIINVLGIHEGILDRIATRLWT